MPSLADAFIHLRVDRDQVRRDTEDGLKRVDASKAGAAAGTSYGKAFGSGLRSQARRIRLPAPDSRPWLALTNHITGTGDALKVLERRASLVTRVWAGLNLATGLLESSVSALLGTLGALTSALTAAGAGIGAYGLAAMESFKKVADSQKAMNQWLASRTPAALKKYKQSLAQLTPAQRDLVDGLNEAKTAWQAWGDRLSQPVLDPLIKALGLVKPLLRAITPFVRETSKAFSDLMGSIGRGMQGERMTEWLRTMKPLIRPVLDALLRSLGNILSMIGGLSHAFAPFAVDVVQGLERMTRKWADWAWTLEKHSGFQAMIKQWKDNWPSVRDDLGHLMRIVKNIVGNMAAMLTPGNSRTLWQLFHPLLTTIEALSEHPALVQALLYITMIGKAAGPIVGAFNALKSGWGSLSGIVSALTGGKISLGMQGAGDTMLAAAANMQRAADTMLGATGAGGKAGASVTVAQAGKWPWVVAVGKALGIEAAAIFAIRAALSLMPPQPKGERERARRRSPFPNLGEAIFGKGGTDFAAWWDKHVSQPIANSFRHVWDDSYRTFMEKIGSPVAHFFTVVIPQWGKNLGRWLWTNPANSVIGAWRVVQRAWTVAWGAILGYLRLAFLKIKLWFLQHVVDPVVDFLAKIPGPWRSTFEGMRNSVHKQMAMARGDIAGVQAAINGLHDKKVSLTVDAHGRWEIAQMFRKRGQGAGPQGYVQKGLRLPGYGGGDRIPLMAEAGETVVSKEHSRLPFMRAAFKAAGVPGYAGGGYVNATLSGVTGGYRNGPAGAGRWLTRADNATLRQLEEAAATAAHRALTTMIPPGGAGPGMGGAGVARWAPVILAALRMLGQSPGWLGLVERRMAQESGGNAYAVNKWDINWQRGTPSVGLMQVIGPTFAQWAGPFRRTGPFLYGVSVSPLANIYAGLRYTLARYGSLGALARPGGYDRGGWLPPGLSLAENRTGQPERVLPPGASGVTVNMGPVSIRENADVDLLARRLDFSIRSAAFT